MSTTVSFAALSITVTILGIDGKPKASPAVRPLRVLPTGGFGCVFHGKVLPLTPTGADTGTVTLTDARLDPALCRAAKMADIGKSRKADADKDPPKSATTGKAGSAPSFTKAPDAGEPAKKPRTIAQMRSTVAMCAARAEKALGIGDEDTIAKALKALETAEGNLAKAVAEERAKADAAAKAEADAAKKPSKKAKAKSATTGKAGSALAEAGKADAGHTKAQVMAELDRLAKLLASMG